MTNQGESRSGFGDLVIINRRWRWCVNDNRRLKFRRDAVILVQKMFLPLWDGKGSIGVEGWFGRTGTILVKYPRSITSPNGLFRLVGDTAPVEAFILTRSGFLPFT